MYATKKGEFAVGEALRGFPMYVHICMHTYIHTCVPRKKDDFTVGEALRDLHRYVIFVHIHTYMHAYVHTYINTHTYICLNHYAEFTINGVKLAKYAYAHTHTYIHTYA